jgi:hypothetical protein
MCWPPIIPHENSWEALIDTSKKVGLDVNREKTKYMLMSHHQNAGKNHGIEKVINPLKMWHISNIWERQFNSKFDSGGN